VTRPGDGEYGLGLVLRDGTRLEPSERVQRWASGLSEEEEGREGIKQGTCRRGLLQWAVIHPGTSGCQWNGSEWYDQKVEQVEGCGPVSRDAPLPEWTPLEDG
jgi:hypothetical protein